MSVENRSLDQGDFLTKMREISSQRLIAAQKRTTESALRARFEDAGPVRPLKLHSDGFDLIAEVKLRSPSGGSLLTPNTLPLGEVWSRSATYAKYGAAAISVLTEPSAFDGALSHLEVASRACEVPVMRKDFLVDPWQILETRAAGGSGALIIVRLLDDATLNAMVETAASLGLFVLLEAFDQGDLDRAKAVRSAGTVLIGVNSRDLSTLAVDPDRLRSMAASLSSDAIPVAESGLLTPEDAANLSSDGYRLALVGTALMGHSNPGLLLSEMVAAGRKVRQ